MAVHHIVYNEKTLKFSLQRVEQNKPTVIIMQSYNELDCLTAKKVIEGRN